MELNEGVGLVCAGSVSQSFLTRMPALLRHLGPIKTSNFRVSRKIVKALRAGYAASHYSALEPCQLILVWLPEAKLDRIVRDMTVRTPIRKAPFSTNMVVLCESARDSTAAAALRGTGARVATLNLIPESSERLFVAEGHPAVLRCMRTVLAEDRRKLIVLKPHTKPLFFAGIHASSPLLLPWIAAGMASLRACGLSRSQAAWVGEVLGTRALRRYAKAGIKAWSRETETELRRALDHGLPEIRSRYPSLAELYEEGIRLALRRF